MWKCKEWWDNQLTLGIWCRPFLESASPTSCKTPATFIDSIDLKQSIRKKQRTQKWDWTSNKLYCTALAYVHRNQGLARLTWNPVLREAVTRSTCWNRQKQTLLKIDKAGKVFNVAGNKKKLYHKVLLKYYFDLELLQLYSWEIFLKIS